MIKVSMKNGVSGDGFTAKERIRGEENLRIRAFKSRSASGREKTVLMMGMVLEGSLCNQYSLLKRHIHSCGFESSAHAHVKIHGRQFSRLHTDHRKVASPKQYFRSGFSASETKSHK